MNAAGGIARAFQMLWEDRRRFLLAGVAAVLLWFLVGGKVVDTVTENVPVRIIEAGRFAPLAAGDGLFIQVPDNLALVSYEQKRVKLSLQGTDENLRRLDEGPLAGTLEIPRDFCDNEKRTTESDIDVVSRFQFAPLGGVDVVGAEPVAIRVVVQQRASDKILLTPANLTFSPVKLAENVEVDFDPDFLEISGPFEEIARIKQNPALLQLTSPIERAEFEALLQEPRSYSTSRLFVREGDQVRTLVRSVDVPSVRVSLGRKSEARTVTRSNVPVEVHVPERLQRPDHVAKQNPAMVAVTLAVDEQFFLDGGTEAELFQDLAVFVNVADLKGLDGGSVPVQILSLPDAVKEARTDPESISLEWSRVDGSDE